MTISTARILEVYEETRSHTEAAKRLGMGADAVRKRLKRADLTPVVPGKSVCYDKDNNPILTWSTGRGVGGATAEEVAEAVSTALKDYRPSAPLKTAPVVSDKSLATVMPFPDLHFGLLSWRKETGIDWDMKIAQEIYRKVTARLISSSPKSDTCVVLGLGDLLHTDNYDNMTTKGTPQDQDGRYPKMLYEATQFLMYVIDLAAERHKKVIVVVLPGNHDEQSAVAVRLALSLHYYKHKNISVCDDAGRFWYWEWGKNLLAATHGDKLKKSDLPLLMASTNPEAWGRTVFRAYFTGHIHHETGLDKGQVRVESFQAPVAKDSWHASRGYGGGQSLQTITYHKDDGEISRQRVNIKTES